jgi:UPF0176 protein
MKQYAEDISAILINKFLVQSSMKNILFYKFIAIENLEKLQHKLQEVKILIAHEGINGCVSGADEEIMQFQDLVQKELGSIEFKEGIVSEHTFKKMFVRIRSEIITFKQDIRIEETASYIEPQELKEALDKGEEIILLDARNNYESAIGKFKDAIAPDIDIFSDLPAALRAMPELKEKRIVTYCTGGIRCEKSSAWMRQNGFKNVKQLHGGIIRYGEECGNTHWEGKCFVFDRRGAIDIDPTQKSAPITTCILCNSLAGTYHNCANCDCDKLFVCCDDCVQKNDSCCSTGCKEIIIALPAKRAVTYIDEKRPQQLSQ